MRLIRTSLAIGCLLVVAGVAQAQVAAKQGDSQQGNPGGYEEFRSPMILEILLPLADQSRWDDKSDWWLTSTENLRKYRCEKISMTLLQAKQRRMPGGKVDLSIAASFFNPDQNHDKKVRVQLDVLNGEQVSGTLLFRDFKLKEGSISRKTAQVAVSGTALVVDPPTKVRVTMMTWDY